MQALYLRVIRIFVVFVHLSICQSVCNQSIWELYLPNKKAVSRNMWDTGNFFFSLSLSRSLFNTYLFYLKNSQSRTNTKNRGNRNNAKFLWSKIMIFLYMLSLFNLICERLKCFEILLDIQTNKLTS